jgi:methanol metabolism-related c-type cytochrome
VKNCIGPVGLSVLAFLLSIGIANADGAGDPTAVSQKDGRYYDKDGNPTFKVQPDGTVDWSTYSGFRRYHSECHVCHGPDGEGSTYAPALKDSLKTLSYAEFLTIVATGRQNVNTASENVMPAFGENKNVTCYLDDIYTYLRARANNAIGRGRPAKHEDKPDASAKAESACMGLG